MANRLNSERVGVRDCFGPGEKAEIYGQNDQKNGYFVIYLY